MWTFQRYRAWLDKRSSFHQPMREAEPEDAEVAAPVHSAPRLPAAPPPPSVRAEGAPAPRPERTEAGRIEIEPSETFEKILKK
jgi:hypothetical protein